MQRSGVDGPFRRPREHNICLELGASAPRCAQRRPPVCSATKEVRPRRPRRGLPRRSLTATRRAWNGKAACGTDVATNFSRPRSVEGQKPVARGVDVCGPGPCAQRAWGRQLPRPCAVNNHSCVLARPRHGRTPPACALAARPNARGGDSRWQQRAMARHGRPPGALRRSTAVDAAKPASNKLKRGID